ncbi:MAG: hypothetical protein OEW94_12800 [Betaproteobacteria bacterium]|nr:hypothetical protein [Betaproteobacteria bacterium]
MRARAEYDQADAVARAAGDEGARGAAQDLDAGLSAVRGVAHARRDVEREQQAAPARRRAAGLADPLRPAGRDDEQRPGGERQHEPGARASAPGVALPAARLAQERDGERRGQRRGGRREARREPRQHERERGERPGELEHQSTAFSQARAAARSGARFSAVPGGR